MDAEIKRKWVEALRSGKYEQGKYDFEKGGKFCCLGVLCVVEGQPTMVEDAGNWLFVVELLGQAQPDERDRALRLSDMNDSGAPFSEIANYIERHL